jgi:hypothetical protein
MHLAANDRVNLDKVESVDVNQSVLGRLLGYGDIMIHGVFREPFLRIEGQILRISSPLSS